MTRRAGLRQALEPLARMIPTDDGPAEVGRLVMMGETERNVRDMLAETGADPEANSGHSRGLDLRWAVWQLVARNE